MEHQVGNLLSNGSRKKLFVIIFKVKNKENPLRSLANLVSKSGSAT